MIFLPIPTVAFSTPAILAFGWVTKEQACPSHRTWKQAMAFGEGKSKEEDGEDH